VLPGVGAFSQGMEELRTRGLDVALIEATRRGTPLLGICLGMQLLFDSSLEVGPSNGLGLLAGQIEEIPGLTDAGQSLKVPHVGWSPLIPPDAMYFVHSFMALPADPLDRIADAVYGGFRIPAIVGHANVLACQFHPEKSGEAGLEILAHWVRPEAACGCPSSTERAESS